MERHSAGMDRRQRMTAILDRDGYECTWCRRTIEVGLNRATTDHLVPRVKGGPSWIENEVAACRGCNKRRGHISPTEWIDECQRLGLNPNIEAVSTALAALDARIVREGGQRRARKYLDGQLRRLRRR